MGSQSRHSFAQIHIWIDFSNLSLQLLLVFDGSSQWLDSNVHCQVNNKISQVFPSPQYNCLSKWQHISPQEGSRVPIFGARQQQSTSFQPLSPQCKPDPLAVWWWHFFDILGQENDTGNSHLSYIDFCRRIAIELQEIVHTTFRNIHTYSVCHKYLSVMASHFISGYFIISLFQLLLQQPSC